MISHRIVYFAVIALLTITLRPICALSAPTLVFLNPTSQSKNAQMWLVSERPMPRLTVHVNGYRTSETTRKTDSGAPYAKRYELTPTKGNAPYVSRKMPVSARLCPVSHPTNGAPCTVLPIATSSTNFRPADDGVWQDQRQWTQEWEAVFSVWVRHLFRPLPNERNRGWRRLHDVLRNPNRNFLHNQLGLAEDTPASHHHIMAVADCGDLPYLLRAYFAWKFSLPFRYSACSRGTGQKGPICTGEVDNRTDRYRHAGNPVERMNQFLTHMTWHVHSGTFRTLPQTESSDFYPIALSRDAIRPGTVFVDPGGHVLMVSQWNSEGLFAVDGHPDKTVTRRRFAPQYFPVYPGLSTGGFKAFRPFRRVKESWVASGNSSLSPAWSPMQYRFSSKQAFYVQMNTLIANQ